MMEVVRVGRTTSRSKGAGEGVKLRYPRKDHVSRTSLFFRRRYSARADSSAVLRTRFDARVRGLINFNSPFLQFS